MWCAPCNAMAGVLRCSLYASRFVWDLILYLDYCTLFFYNLRRQVRTSFVTTATNGHRLKVKSGEVWVSGTRSVGPTGQETLLTTGPPKDGGPVFHTCMHRSFPFVVVFDSKNVAQEENAFDQVLRTAHRALSGQSDSPSALAFVAYVHNLQSHCSATHNLLI